MIYKLLEQKKKKKISQLYNNTTHLKFIIRIFLGA